MQTRSSFSNKIGFVLAAAGSAVGLGNIWRFPYLAAKYGGGIFLLTYIILVVTLGFTLMTTEIAIGRKTRQSPIGAFQQLNPKFTFIGVLSFIVPTIVLPYYSVIGGWVMKYAYTFLTGAHHQAAQDDFFTAFTSSTAEPLFWGILFLTISLGVILLGVKDGIEKANKIMMPALIVLSIAICIYSVTLPGAIEGVKYYLLPDFTKFSAEGVLAALGQMFYSLSLAMGIMITYGSYMRKEDHLEHSVKQIELFDTGVAFLAGLMVVPAVVAFSGGQQEALNAGPGLMFVTLPKVFDKMGMSALIGSLFFILVFFAAITSCISIMEVITATFCDKLHLSRTKSAFLSYAIALILSIPASLGFGIWGDFRILGFQILDFMDFITNSVLMPITAFLICVFVGFVSGTKLVSDEVELSGQFKRKRMYHVIIKWIAPVCILAILITSILEAF